MMKPNILMRNEGRTVTFGPCRLTYCHVFQKWVGPDGDESRAKYQTGVLIPKGETETLEALRRCIAAAYDQAVGRYWGGRRPRIDASAREYPLHDGDEKGDATYAGHVYLTAKSGKRPPVTEADGTPMADEDQLYSGVWAWLCVTFYGYNTNGNKGIAVALEAVRKCRDDEQLGGGIAMDEAFAGIGAVGQNDPFAGALAAQQAEAPLGGAEGQGMGPGQGDLPF